MQFAIATLIWVLGHLYLGFRLIESSKPPAPVRIAGWVLVVFFGTLTYLALGANRLELPMAEQLGFVGYVVMGFIFIVFFMVFARDVVLAVIWAVNKVRGLITSRDTDRDDAVEDRSPAMSRRRLLMGASSAGIAALGATSTAIGYVEARRIARVKKVEVKIPGLDPRLDGFKIVQLSDLHIGPTLKRDFLQAVVERTNELNPDLVAITGDLIDGFVDVIGDQVEPLQQLRARHGAFFVTGNHEYYWDGVAWANHVAKLGLGVLINEHRVIQHEGAPFVVAGVTDYSAGRHFPPHTSDPVKAVAGAPDAFKLLLAHQPKSVYKASEAKIDLQLSGHTHGGQFWPWTYLVGLAHPFLAGLGKFEEMMVYVSRGTGYWGPPLRLGAPSEITELTLRRA